MFYGYARVSTLDQDLTLQRAALKAAGCEVIRAEKATGTRRDGRTELQVLLEFLREGDTLVVTRIDRLARSVKDLQDIVHELKARGVHKGRLPTIDAGAVRRLAGQGIGSTEIARQLKISRASVYRLLEAVAGA